MDVFATNFDTDSDGVIDFEEFKVLYVHLGGTVEPTTVDNTQVDARREHPFWDLFSTHDLNGDGKLSQYEVQQMMLSMGYKAEESYVQQTMERFGQYDHNGDNSIDLDEFAQLWQHLGGELPAGAELQENRLRTQLMPELEPESQIQPQPVRTREHFRRQLQRKESMLNGHSVEHAIAAVQEGAVLTVYLPTGKKQHSRFFWVHRSSGNKLQLCWGKKKGASKYRAELLYDILPEPDIKTAAELFHEVRVHATLHCVMGSMWRRTRPVVLADAVALVAVVNFEQTVRQRWLGRN